MLSLFQVVVIACSAILGLVTMYETNKRYHPDRKLEPEDYEIGRDPVSVTHFLPSRRCKNRDE